MTKQKAKSRKWEWLAQMDIGQIEVYAYINQQAIHGAARYWGVKVKTWHENKMIHVQRIA